MILLSLAGCSVAPTPPRSVRGLLALPASVSVVLPLRVPTNSAWILERSTNLANWHPWGFAFEDGGGMVTTSAPPVGFFRARSLP